MAVRTSNQYHTGLLTLPVLHQPPVSWTGESQSAPCGKAVQAGTPACGGTEGGEGSGGSIVNFFNIEICLSSEHGGLGTFYKIEKSCPTAEIWLIKNDSYARNFVGLTIFAWKIGFTERDF